MRSHVHTTKNRDKGRRSLRRRQYQCSPANALMCPTKLESAQRAVQRLARPPLILSGVWKAAASRRTWPRTNHVQSSSSGRQLHNSLRSSKRCPLYLPPLGRRNVPLARVPTPPLSRHCPQSYTSLRFFSILHLDFPPPLCPPPPLPA